MDFKNIKILKIPKKILESSLRPREKMIWCLIYNIPNITNKEICNILKNKKDDTSRFTRVLKAKNYIKQNEFREFYTDLENNTFVVIPFKALDKYKDRDIIKASDLYLTIGERVKTYTINQIRYTSLFNPPVAIKLHNILKEYNIEVINE